MSGTVSNDRIGIFLFRTSCQHRLLHSANGHDLSDRLGRYDGDYLRHSPR